MSENVKVEYTSEKEALFGSECGSILWINGADEPMGTFFCRADSKLVKSPVKIDIWKEMSPALYASESGRVDNESVQIVLSAKDNSPGVFVNPEIVESKEVLALTEAGVNLISTTSMKDGKIQTSKCTYKKR